LYPDMVAGGFHPLPSPGSDSLDLASCPPVGVSSAYIDFCGVLLKVRIHNAYARALFFLFHPNRRTPLNGVGLLKETFRGMVTVRPAAEASNGRVNVVAGREHRGRTRRSSCVRGRSPAVTLVHGFALLLRGDWGDLGKTVNSVLLNSGGRGARLV